MEIQIRNLGEMTSVQVVGEGGVVANVGVAGNEMLCVTAINAHEPSDIEIGSVQPIDPPMGTEQEQEPSEGETDSPEPTPEPEPVPEEQRGEENPAEPADDGQAPV